MNPKTLLRIVTIILAAISLGCASPWTKQQTCETAKAAYEAYLAVMHAGKSPSMDQIIAAQAAAAFLSAYCGSLPQATKGLPPGPRYHPTDENGVLVLSDYQ